MNKAYLSFNSSFILLISIFVINCTTEINIKNPIEKENFNTVNTVENSYTEAGGCSAMGDYLFTHIGNNKLFTIDPLLAIKLSKESSLKTSKEVIQAKNLDNENIRKIFECINKDRFCTKDVDQKNIYINIGRASKLLEEASTKFPNSDHSILKQFFDDEVTYAYILIKLKYLNKFNNRKRKFQNKAVNGFGLSLDDNYICSKQKRNIDILDFQNEDKFILKLRSKNRREEIIIAKGWNNFSPDDVLNAIKNSKIDPNLFIIKDFWMPKIKFKIARKYKEISENSKETAIISETEFIMDEEGTKVESRTVEHFCTAGPPNKKPKVYKFVNLYFDKSYMVIMRRNKSFKNENNNPYFAFINNDTSVLSLIN